MSRLLAFAAAALLLTASSISNAASCCLSAAAFGVGRLRLGETWALGYSASLADVRGRWDAAGQWMNRPEGYREREWRQEFWGLRELSDDLSGFVRLPFLLNDRRSGTTRRQSGGVGDMQAGARWEWVPLRAGDTGPALALTASLALPTGRSTDESDNPLGADVTGRGAWVPGLSGEVEWTGAASFLRMEAGVTAPLPFRRADIHQRQQFGPGLQVALSGGIEIAAESALSLLIGWEREADLRIGGERVPDSAQSGWHLGPSLALALDESWTFLARLDGAVAADGWGDNANGRLSATAGVRYGY